MQTRDFLSAALGDDGYICVFGANPVKKRVIQKLYPTIDAACAAADNLKEEGFDAYFGLAAYETDKSRRADNAKHLKSFFLDIDCGPHKSEVEGYPGGQQDGLAALQRFCKTTGLPRPTLVNSGRGLHVYWLLAEPVAPKEWLPVAERLKALCVQHNLVADPAVTADVARVLRVPGTLNFKDDPAKSVELIGEPREPLTFEQIKTILGVQEKRTLNATFSAEDDIASALLGNYRNVFKTILMKTANGRGCAQLQKVIEDQENIQEPLWRAGLSIAKFCVDVEKAAHRISSKHPEYDPDETAKKLDQIKGPYTCDSFDKLNPGVCTSCPNRNKIKSPIVLGREVREASEEDNVVEDVPQSAPTAGKQTYVIPTYPAPYFRGVRGGVFLRKKDKDGDPVEVLIYHNDIYVVRRITDAQTGEAALVRLHLPKDGVREFTIPLASMLSKDEFRKFMAMNGVAVINMEGLMTYMTKWVNKLQAEVQSDIARRQFGWTSDMAAFIIGTKEVRADRIDYNPPSHVTSLSIGAFQTNGTLEGWVSLMEFYNRPGMELYQYVLGLSFGSPLVAFSSDGAALFHMWSKDPGLGKSAALRVGNSVWGHPDELLLLERDTYNSKMHRAEVHKNIFLSIDELSNIAPKDASDFLYQLTGYRQRNRLSTSGNVERYRGDPWRTNVGSNGNTSLISRVLMYKAMPKAEAVRVLEYHVPKNAVVGEKRGTDEFNRKLLDNYGVAGIPFMQYVIRKLEDSKNLFVSVQERVDKAAGLSQPHRFWSSQAASALAGLIIAKKLGLVNFDLSNLFKWIVNRIEENKTELLTETQDPETVLTSYLAENYNNVLRIKSTDDSRNLGNQDVYVVPDSSPRVQLVARYEYDVKRMYLLPKPFRDWCLKLQLPYQDILNGLKRGTTKAVIKKTRIGKGTRMNLPPVDAIVLDCTHFMDEEREEEIAELRTIADLKPES